MRDRSPTFTICFSKYLYFFSKYPDFFKNIPKNLPLFPQLIQQQPNKEQGKTLHNFTYSLDFIAPQPPRKLYKKSYRLFTPSTNAASPKTSSVSCCWSLTIVARRENTRSAATEDDCTSTNSVTVADQDRDPTEDTSFYHRSVPISGLEPSVS